MADCVIEGCGQPARARGLCPMHYKRWQVHGDPHAEVARGSQPREADGARQVLLSRRTITPSGCWEYNRSRTVTDGYGAFYWTPYRTAHRASYVLFIGPIPAGMCVCHRCDNPPCFNPEHLFLGSDEANRHDMRNKGRDRSFKARPCRGEAAPRAKLTEAQVHAIRADTRVNREIATTYGVSRSLIGAIKTRAAWAHVE